MNTPLRTIRLGETPPPTHQICAPVCAMRILAVDELASHRRLTCLLDGEAVHVDVPPAAEFCRRGTPVMGDYLLIAPDGTVSHRAGELFEAESTVIGRGQRDPFRGACRPHPSAPLLPG